MLNKWKKEMEFNMKVDAIVLFVLWFRVQISSYMYSIKEP